MTRRLPLLTLAIAVCCLLISAPLAAQIASPFHIVPVVAKLGGAVGSDWLSDMSISNLSDRTVTVGIEFFREAQANSFTGAFSVTITLAAGETRTIEDVLGTLFPEEGNTKGALLVLVQEDGTEDPAAIAVTTRTYNAANPDATYGQTVPTSLIALIYGNGVATMPGARWDSRVRTNVGVVNLGPFAASVEIAVFQSDGSERTRVTRTVEAFSLRQWGLTELGVSSLADGRVEVRLDPDTTGFDPCADLAGFGFSTSILIPYFSKADNVTSDGEFGYGQVDWSEYSDSCGGENPSEGCTGDLTKARSMMESLLASAAARTR